MPADHAAHRRSGPSAGAAPVAGRSPVRAEPTTRAVLAALRSMKEATGAMARAHVLVQRSAELSGAVAAVLVVYGESGRVVRRVPSTDDPERRRLADVVVDRAEQRRAVPPAGSAAVDGEDGQPPAWRLPVRVMPGVPGALYLVGVEEPGGGEDDLVRGFVELASLVLESGVRHEESAQQLAWREALADVTQVLLSSAADDETPVWQRIADHLLRLARARAVTISAPSEDDPELLVIRVAAGVGRELLAGHTYPGAGTLGERAMTSGTGQLAHPPEVGVPGLIGEVLAPLGPLLALPLIGPGAIHGAVVLSRALGQEEFNRRDLTMAQEFAAQATLALELAETRAAQLSLQARTELERVSDTFQDHIIQRLFALGLTLDLAGRQDPELWLERAKAELAETLAEARSSLQRNHGVLG